MAAQEDVVLDSSVIGQCAHDVIRQHLVMLLDAVTFDPIVDQLYANGLIDEVYEIVTNRAQPLTTKDKGRKIICEIQKMIRSKPKLFETFCDILESDEKTRNVAKAIREKYNEMFSALKLESEDDVELTDLRESLSALIKKLPKMKGCIKEAMLTSIKSLITDYIDTSIGGGVSTSKLCQQIFNLGNREMLIPSDLVSWATQYVDTQSKLCPLTQNVPQCSSSPCVSKQCPSLFSDDTLYHTTVCCNAVSMSTSEKCRQYLESINTGHLFGEVSVTNMSSTHRYLIARQKSKKLLYFAFNSEPKVSSWKEGCSFEEGIQKQMDQIPVRFFVEQLKDQWEIVLTGFSFGGMLACYVAASIWKFSFISPDDFKQRVICITYGQPLIAMSHVEDIIKTSSDFKDSLHLIYQQNDVIPRLLRFASINKIPSSSSNEKIDNKSSTVQVYQPTTMSVCLRSLGILQEQEKATYSNAVVQPIADTRKQALGDLQNALKTLTSVANIQDTGSGLLLASCYVLIPEKQPVLISKDKAYDELGYFSSASVDELNEEIFKQHNMDYFKICPPQLVESTSCHIPIVDILVPKVEGVAFHTYGSEVAVVVQGDQLWFCHKVCLGEGSQQREISTPAHHVTRKSIQFNYTPNKMNDIPTNCDEIKVTLYSHFSGPVGSTVPVKRKTYPCTLRQAQLAKHTPSEIIQLAYLSAMLEQPSYSNSRPDLSERFKTTTKFLEEAVAVVPIESIFYAIAYGDEDVAIRCSEALKQRKLKIPPSEMVITASQYAALRVVTGCRKEFIDHIDLQMRVMNLSLHNSLSLPMKLSIIPPPKNCLRVTFQYGVYTIPDITRPRKVGKLQHLYSDAVAAPKPHYYPRASTKSPMPEPQIMTFQMKSEMEFSLPPKDEDTSHANEPLTTYLQKFAEDIYEHGCSKLGRGQELPYMCGLSINEVYQTSSSKDALVLPSPTNVLKVAQQKLSKLVKEACQEVKGTHTAVNQDQSSEQCYPDLSSFHNLEMLKTINSIRDQALNLCTSLLSAFMEQQIRIPLINSSPLETANALTTSPAPIAVGVWALLSLNYGDIKEMLVSLRGKPLLVDITNYIMGIFNSPLRMEDTRYAGKLQFLLQGMGGAVSCSSQYISYSLEQQLLDLCEKRLQKSINSSTSLENMIENWDSLFKGDALSLVATPHRPLIARWLRWALLIHQLREKLAEYTAVGVIGLSNSGKSHLVNKLFGVQTLVGTTLKKRTTIPLLYNFDGSIKKLDVIDFPGVDDQDETIPQLAKLLLGLAQIVIFVVDYRKIHTQSAKSWLTELESEQEAVPILVCLTHADRLYAEIAARKGNSKESKDVIEWSKRCIGSELSLIKEQLGHSPSRDVDFYSFNQDPDSNLNTEKGRKTLQDVGIHRIKDVGNWIVEKLRSHIDQPDLAKKLQDHFDKQR